MDKSAPSSQEEAMQSKELQPSWDAPTNQEDSVWQERRRVAPRAPRSQDSSKHPEGVK